MTEYTFGGPVGPLGGGIGMPAPQFTGKPTFFWGLNLAVQEGLETSLKNARSYLDVDAVYVGPSRPNDTSMYPALLVNFSAVSFKKEGINGYQEIPGSSYAQEPYFSEGNVEIELLARSPEQLWTLQDFIIQRYLGEQVYTDSFYRSGESLYRVAIAFNPGKLTWSARDFTEVPWSNNQVTNISTSKCSWNFLGEHYLIYDQPQVSAVNIDATPVERMIDLTYSAPSKP